jgi:Zn finger protein HypA/HybF involved in hydrogenase expression
MSNLFIWELLKQIMTKQEEIEIELKELDKLLENKKISPKKYLDLKAKLEMQIKEKAIKTAKEVTKPKVLNIICPNCGSPQREVKKEEFNCEMCGKLIRLFDATKEAEELLEKIPGMMENVALERLFIEPEKFKIETGLQKEIIINHILEEKLKPIIGREASLENRNLLNDCFASLYDSHGFRFLDFDKLLDENLELAINIHEVRNTREAFIIIPFYGISVKEGKTTIQKTLYDDENFVLWSKSEIDDLLDYYEPKDKEKIKQKLIEFRKEIANKKGIPVEKLDEREIIKQEKDFIRSNFESRSAKYSKLSLTGALVRLVGEKIENKLASKKEEKQQLIFPWYELTYFESRAKECLDIVKPLNELANIFAVFSAYSSDLKLNFFLSSQSLNIRKVFLTSMRETQERGKPEETLKTKGKISDIPGLTEEKGVKDAEKEIFGYFPSTCWANFYKGLASYAQAYGKLLLVMKEYMEKNIPFKKLVTTDIISNFENASEAFKRASENSDERRKYYLDFYSHVCEAFADALKGKSEDSKIKKLEKEKGDIIRNDIENNIIRLNQGHIREGTGSTVTSDRPFYYETGEKRWNNQRILGLARIVEGPRFLFYVDVLMIKDLISKI